MSWNDPGVYEVCAKVLRSGGVVLHPTETCYGLAVDVFNERALDKLYGLKRMAKDKPVSVLIEDLEMAKVYGDFSERALSLAERYWPGPLSILVKRRMGEGGLPLFLNPREDFVSLRCSGMSFCSEMVKSFGGPVSTTSANVTTEPQAYSLDDLSEDFLKNVDLVVDMGQIEKNSPSTIVRVDGNEFVVLRQGDLEVR